MQRFWIYGIYQEPAISQGHFGMTLIRLRFKKLMPEFIHYVLYAASTDL
jgi:hypothetical protein